ncbi:hypothetical protein SANTM175S_06459 [Streptomyces antimycoticus]
MRSTSPPPTRTSSADALEPYTKGGRRTGGRASGGRGKARAASGGSQDTAKIRAWAKENGYEVNDRGRVPATVREAYEKANGERVSLSRLAAALAAAGRASIGCGGIR